MKNALTKAISEKKLEVYYQPKVDILSGNICGAEALCRWHDEKLGQISPVQFIPLAERLGLIMALNNFVLEKACQQQCAWHAQELPKFPISVNISSQQLLQKDFRQNVIRILQETQLDAEYLDLEITETSYIQNIDAVLRNIVTIKELGVSFSLDDFGTAYSSLYYIQQFPIKIVKIDISFIRDITKNERDGVIVRHIIALSKELGLLTVAEGVETLEQLNYLRFLQCDQIQGYLYSKALPADEFKALMLENKKLPGSNLNK